MDGVEPTLRPADVIDHRERPPETGMVGIVFEIIRFRLTYPCARASSSRRFDPFQWPCACPSGRAPARACAATMRSAAIKAQQQLASLVIPCSRVSAAAAVALRTAAGVAGVTRARLRDDGTIIVHSPETGYRAIIRFATAAADIVTLDRSRYDADPYLRLALQRLWITAGNDADAYRNAAGLPPGIEPWSERCGHRSARKPDTHDARRLCSYPWIQWATRDTPPRQ